jgi:hypothetical protein
LASLPGGEDGAIDAEGRRRNQHRVDAKVDDRAADFVDPSPAEQPPIASPLCMIGRLRPQHAPTLHSGRRDVALLAQIMILCLTNQTPHSCSAAYTHDLKF